MLLSITRFGQYFLAAAGKRCRKPLRSDTNNTEKALSEGVLHGAIVPGDFAISVSSAAARPLP